MDEDSVTEEWCILLSRAVFQICRSVYYTVTFISLAARDICIRQWEICHPKENLQ